MKYSRIFESWRGFINEGPNIQSAWGTEIKKQINDAGASGDKGDSDLNDNNVGDIIHSQNCSKHKFETTVRSLLDNTGKGYSSKMRAGIAVVITEVLKPGQTGQTTLSTKYMHLDTIDSQISDGGKVKKGQIIGTLGKSGMFDPNPKNASKIKGFKWCHVGNPHLHFEVYINGADKNPGDYINIKRKDGIEIADPVGKGNTSKIASGHGAVNSGRPGHRGADIGLPNGESFGENVYAAHDGEIRIINSEEGFIKKIEAFFNKNNLVRGQNSIGWKQIEGVYLRQSEIVSSEEDIP